MICVPGPGTGQGSRGQPLSVQVRVDGEATAGRRAAGSRAGVANCGSHRGDVGWTRQPQWGAFQQGVYASAESPFTQSVSRIQPHFRLGPQSPRCVWAGRFQRCFIRTV